jgi:23S rRNA (pseudouridine1915-N3)-methyltransferase
MKIKIMTISDSYKDFQPVVDHYQKMLWKSVEIIKIKPTKWWEIQKIIEEDTNKIIKLLQKDKNYKILLSKEGENITTENLTNIIRKQLHITFIIWWPYWLDEDKLDKYIDKKIAFWKITMSHLITLIVLLEQLFRAKTIIEWRKYHY